MARNKHPEETVQKILDAAQQLFLEKGYEQTTILDIVAHMDGLTRGAFYHHFKSKEEVLDALGDKLFRDDNPFEKVRKMTALSGLEKLRYMILDSTRNSDRRKVSVISVEALQSPTFLKKLIDDNRDVVAPMFQEILEEGMRDGSIREQPAALLAELLVLLTNFWTIPSIFPMTEAQAAEKLVFIKTVTDSLGLPILDDSIMETLMRWDKDMLN